MACGCKGKKNKPTNNNANRVVNKTPVVKTQTNKGKTK